MTREEQRQKLSDIRVKVEELIQSYNEALQEGTSADVTRLDKEIDENVSEYTGIARKMCFDELKETSDPMLEAVKRLTFTAIAKKDESVGEGQAKIIVRSMIDKDKPINLAELHKHCGGIGYEKDWVYKIQKLNFLLTAQVAVNLGIDPKTINDSYAMAQVAAEIDLGKNPTSKTNMLRTLQMIVTSMLGEGYKATSHDVNYLLSVYTKKTKKALTVSCADHKRFTSYVAEICHRIVMGKTYGVEYKAKKSN